MDAPALFAPIGPSYDRWATLLSFGQDPRWRRFLVSRIDAGPTDTVLDVATGTAAVALELVRQKDCYVVGVDRTPEMLEEGRRRVTLAAAAKKVRLVEGDARTLPFEDGCFDAVTFTYLLRYVDDPQATLRELARVVKPNGTVAGLEFGVPRGVWHPLWEAWVRAGLPAAGRLIGGGWHEVGTFLGPSIRDHYARWPLSTLLGFWRDAGIEQRLLQAAEPRRRDRDVGTPELRPAWYALRRGRVRDWVTVLHPPYTLWHLSYVALGAALAPHFHTDRLVAALIAFFLALGVAAHVLDELGVGLSAPRFRGRRSSAQPSSHWRAQSESGLRPPSRGARACSPSSRSARCSCLRTTSSGSAAASTPTGGSHSRGGRFRC